MLAEYINGFVNKTVGFVGLGISNFPILEMFGKVGISLTVRDLKELSPENKEICKKYNVHTITGEAYLDDIHEDVLFLSPAIKQFLPQLKKAKDNGVYITTEMQEFFKLCPCKIIAVTGSDGKTTTTTLIAELLKKQGYTVHLGGNIGKNLMCQLDSISVDDFAVVELSSFQLMKMSISPDIAVITNVSPNHLDWHHDMEEYTAAKKNIFIYQSKNNKTVLNLSSDATAKMCCECKGSVVTFGVGVGDYRIEPDGIYKDDKLILSDDDILLPGAHNRQNYAAAIAATDEFVSLEAVKELARTFGGVEHRIELVRNLNSVKFYNSSIDSSPSRTAAALNSFKQKLIVICGGYDKNIPLGSLGPLFIEKAKAVVLMGNTGPKIEAVLNGCNYNGCIKKARCMEEAVKTAYSIAEKDDIIILSPAAASFDMFKNFAERGNIFKSIVHSL